MKTQDQVPVKVQIECSPIYVAEESKPEQSYYFFSYKIRIHNKSRQCLQILSRHWIITDAFGRTEEVRGPGVVGLQPKIQSKQFFEYDSACPLTTPTGSMKGTYTMMTEDGQSVEVSIPEFYLICPQSLH
jgi:ApaG protein